MYVCLYVCTSVSLSVCNACDGVVRKGMVWSGMVWYATVRYAMVWFGKAS